MTFLTLGTAFGAGFLASLSPCIYPMLPITIGFLTKEGAEQKRQNKKLKILLFFFGQVVAFTGLGLVAVKAGEIFGFSSESFVINLVVGLLLLLFAASTLDYFQPVFAKLSAFMPKAKIKDVNYLTAFVFGATSALVASPCTSPVLGGILSKIASEGEIISGVFQMAAFSSGMGIIFLVLGFGVLSTNKIPRSGLWMIYVHKLTVLLLVLGSIYYLYNAYEAY
jgi:cytochrome c-type biogenesis protein